MKGLRNILLVLTSLNRDCEEASVMRDCRLYALGSRGLRAYAKPGLILTYLMRTIMSLSLNSFTSSLATKALAASSDSRTAKMEPCGDDVNFIYTQSSDTAVEDDTCMFTDFTIYSEDEALAVDLPLDLIVSVSTSEGLVTALRVLDLRRYGGLEYDYLYIKRCASPLEGAVA